MMTETSSTESAVPLMNKGMLAVTIAQFLSAFGDNALLFTTLALIDQLLYPDWSKPLMQMAFVAAYILLAPFVGQVADSFPKGRVMMVANGLKMLGALLIGVGQDPFIGYTLVGVGAALYSPAKYGILGELTSGAQLVKANGVIEASTIIAILVGSVAGGVLSDWNITLALWVCVLLYAGALLANLRIPRLVASRHGESWRPVSLCRHFWSASKVLWRQPDTRFSLLGTSLFWGSGVTLRFLLVLWVPVALGITNHTMPTVLNAMVAIGVAIGAAAAARWVTLEKVRYCIPSGILMGVGVLLFSLQGTTLMSYLLLVVIGILGGFFVVPLNALLQDRGKQSVGAGHAIAVQNLGENSAMLLMLGLYSLAIKVGLPVVGVGIAFGFLFAVAITGLWWTHRQPRSVR